MHGKTTSKHTHKIPHAIGLIAGESVSAAHKPQTLVSFTNKATIDSGSTFRLELLFSPGTSSSNNFAAASWNAALSLAAVWSQEYSFPRTHVLDRHFFTPRTGGPCDPPDLSASSFDNSCIWISTSSPSSPCCTTCQEN